MSLLTNGVIALLDQPDFDTRLAILQVLHILPCVNHKQKQSTAKWSGNWKMLLTDGDSVCYAYITYPCSWLVANGIVKKYSIVSLDAYYLESMVPVMHMEIPYLRVRHMHLKYQLDKAEFSATYVDKWLARVLVRRYQRQHTDHSKNVTGSVV